MGVPPLDVRHFLDLAFSSPAINSAFCMVLHFPAIFRSCKFGVLVFRLDKSRAQK